jgi:ferredoxin/flavodoxin---NADP+ reductase
MPTRHGPGAGAIRVAIVGAGPSGLYAADGLLAATQLPVEIDMIDRLPTPFGLVRYGVAPDHPAIKSVARTFEEILAQPRLRFLGGVEVGADVSAEDLRLCYDAVIYATGAPLDRKLGIPGEGTPGCCSASGLVSWYNGHPDANRDVRLDARSVAVIGAGNVALDIARMLARPARDLKSTDVSPRVLDEFRRSKVERVYLIARRGPDAAKFTPKELRELGAIASLDRVVHAGDLAGLDPAASADRRVKANLELLGRWAASAPSGQPRRVEFRFWTRPVAVIADDRVRAVQLSRACDGHVTESLDVDMVVSAIGLRGCPVPGVPFDAARAVIPNREGRVVHPDGSAMAGVYVVGWAKRGPTGVIGTNKADALETVASLARDYQDDRLGERARGSIEELLSARSLDLMGVAGWRNIDRAESELGAREGRSRCKIEDWQALRELASGRGPLNGGGIKSEATR